jgi:hypothetical protein
VSLCLSAAGVAVTIAAQSFSLSWTHTVERTEWREEWRIEGDRLKLVQASVKGSGTGIDPPEGAILKDGAYVWQPSLPPIPALTLRRAPQAGDWRLCAGGRCAPLDKWLGGEADPVELRPCIGQRIRRPAVRRHWTHLPRQLILTE